MLSCPKRTLEGGLCGDEIHCFGVKREILRVIAHLIIFLHSVTDGAVVHNGLLVYPEHYARGIDLHIFACYDKNILYSFGFYVNGNAELKNFLIKILKGVRLLWKLILVH